MEPDAEWSAILENLDAIGDKIDEFKTRYPLFWSIVCEGKSPTAPTSETDSLITDFENFHVEDTLQSDFQLQFDFQPC